MLFIVYPEAVADVKGKYIHTWALLVGAPESVTVFEKILLRISSDATADEPTDKQVITFEPVAALAPYMLTEL